MKAGPDVLFSSVCLQIMMVAAALWAIYLLSRGDDVRFWLHWGRERRKASTVVLVVSMFVFVGAVGAAAVWLNHELGIRSSTTIGYVALMLEAVGLAAALTLSPGSRGAQHSVETPAGHTGPGRLLHAFHSLTRLLERRAVTSLHPFLSRCSEDDRERARLLWFLRWDGDGPGADMLVIELDEINESWPEMSQTRREAILQPLEDVIVRQRILPSDLRARME